MTVRAHAARPLAGVRGLVFAGFPLHPAGAPGIERAAHLAIATGPMLFLQGSRDELADLALLRPIVKRLGARAELAIFKGADHGFTRPRGVIDQLADTTTTWIDRILDS